MEGGVNMQRNIRRMEARPETPSRKRVAAYARVSCGNEEMLPFPYAAS